MRGDSSAWNVRSNEKVQLSTAQRATAITTNTVDRGIAPTMATSAGSFYTLRQSSCDFSTTQFVEGISDRKRLGVS